MVALTHNLKLKIKNLITALALASGCFAAAALAQTNPPADDWKPAPSNMPGQPYPQVNSEGRVRARLRAPEALNVQLNISGIKYPMAKDDEWILDWRFDAAGSRGITITSLVVDGAEVPDPEQLVLFTVPARGAMRLKFPQVIRIFTR